MDILIILILLIILIIILSTDSEGNAIVAKTGMGSSAALTTSLVGALLKFFGVIQLTQNNNNNNLDIDHQRVHYLSQLIHAVAQGKIGSGFDVSAAVFGSQVYQRFSDTKIPFDEIMNPNSDGTILYNTVENKSLWDEQVIPFNLPDGIEVMMGDVCGGSSSSSMVCYLLFLITYYYYFYNIFLILKQKIK